MLESWASPKKTKFKRYAVADCETDPFARDTEYHEPFSWGFYDGEIYVDFWGKDATKQFVEYIQNYEYPLEIYAHNGGGFDWRFLVNDGYITGDIGFIGSRIVEAHLGHHILRDSYVLIPDKLDNLGSDTRSKKKIDYTKLTKRQRERNKIEILDYQKEDCLVLYEAVGEYRKLFGTRSLTMAGTAFNLLKKSLTEDHLTFERLNEYHDAVYRNYYYGGRVQCFESGIIFPDIGTTFKMYDVKSMYPAIMKYLKHPISNTFMVGREINEETDFAHICATSRGALPFRNPRTKAIEFPNDGFAREYFATGHEIRAAQELGLLEIHEIKKAYSAHTRTTCARFVDYFFGMRKKATVKRMKLFFKLVLNSAYGKSGINPRTFTEAVLTKSGERPDSGALYSEIPEDADDETKAKSWSPTLTLPNFTIWERRALTIGKFQNVALAASITGGARALLMRAIHASKRPIYCDTDSLICEEFGGGILGEEIGNWVFEGDIEKAAIAGKKLYALFNDPVNLSDDEKAERKLKYGDENCFKLASKGVSLNSSEIVSVAQGQTVKSYAKAPTFKLNGKQHWIDREVKKTA